MFLRTTSLATIRKQPTPDHQAPLVRNQRLPKLTLTLVLIASSGTPFSLWAQTTPPQSISGVVLAAGTGQPISNALVRISSPAVDMRRIRNQPHELFDGRTDAQGRFVIPVPVAPRISLDAFAAGYESGAGTYYSGNWTLHEVPFPSNRTQEITIKLRRALYVAGVVVEATGQPCPDVVVESTLHDKQGTAYVAFDRTDATGRFQIFDFPLERWNTKPRGQLTFRHPGKLTLSIADVYALTDAARSELRVTLAAGHQLAGRITTATGAPATNTIVEAIPAQESDAQRTTLTDAAGRFHFDALPDGTVKLHAHSPAFDEQVRQTIQLPEATPALELQLKPVVLEPPLKTVPLFGMTLVDVTPELQTVYDLVDPTGVLILDPGPDHQRLGIGTLDPGLSFWIVGERPIKNLREFAAEILRSNNLEPDKATPAGGPGGIRVVYRYRNRAGTNTQRLKLTDQDIAELKELQLAIAR